VTNIVTNIVTGDEKNAANLTRSQVVNVIGERNEKTISAVLATGARIEDVTEAYALATGKSDIVGTGEQSLSGAAAEVYLLLSGDSP